MLAPHLLASISSPWIPGLILAHLYLLFAASLVYSARRLPGRVSTQFNLLGRARRQMSRTAYLIFIAVFGIWLPGFGLVFYLLAKSNPAHLHIPNRAYWLAPEHLAQAQAHLLSVALWFGCLTLAFLIGINLLLVWANRQQPARLPLPLLLVLLACFLAGIIAWSSGLPRYFN
ncbi:MAG TPA: hypothetical protein VN578_06110 [Candidatus Binatia bacterium]|jgi:hypothetical protein|nr:hypothetical protein [Candidatus Binatia bacterium]